MSATVRIQQTPKAQVPELGPDHTLLQLRVYEAGSSQFEIVDYPQSQSVVVVHIEIREQEREQASELSKQLEALSVSLSRPQISGRALREQLEAISLTGHGAGR